MRVVLQRVLQADVVVMESKEDAEKQYTAGSIERGYVLLVGISQSDTKEIVAKVAAKIAGLRVFEDTFGKMNLDLKQVGGKILSVSQFTLYADVAKGRRPGFSRAGDPTMANELYEWFNEKLREEGLVVETGVFQASMQVRLVNDGPLTIVFDTDDWV